MNPLKRVQRVALYISLWTLLSGCGYWGLLYLVDAKQTSLDALYASVDEAANKDVASNVLRRFVAETSEERKNIDAYFLDASNATVVTLLEQIEALGSLTGVSVKVSNVAAGTWRLQDFLQDKKPGTFDTVNLTIAFEGSWTSVYRFLSLLEHMPYAGSIEKMNLDYGTSEATTLPVWQGTAVLVVPKQ